MSFASKAKSGSPPGPGIASSLSNASTQTSFATRAALSSKTTATGPKLKATLHARSSSLPANNVLNPNRKILDTLNHNLVSKPSKRTPDAAAPNITNRTVGSATQVENTRPKASYDLGPGVSKRSPNHISSVAKLSLNALPKSPKSPPRTHVRPTSAPAGIPSFARPTSTSTARVTSASLPKATAKSPSTNAKSTPGGTTPSARSGALRRRMTVTQRPASKTTTTTAQKINAEALDTVIECAKVEKAKADTLSAAIGIGNEDKEMTFGDTEVEELSELRLAYDDSSSDSLDGLGLGEIIDSFPAPSTYIPEPNISIVGDPATTESSPPASSALPTPPLSPVSAACQPLPKGLYKPKGFLDVPRWDFENIPRHAQSRNVAATTRQARRLTMRAPPIVSPFVRRTSFAAMRTARTKPSTAFKTSLGNLTEGVDEAKELQEKTQIPECGGSEGPAVDPKLNGVGSKESRIGSVRNVLHSDRPQGSQQDEDAAVLSRIFHDSVLSDTEADIQDKSLSSPTVKAPEMVKKMAKAGSQDESSSESFDSYPGVLEEIIEFYSDLGDSDGSSGDAPGDADKDVSALLTETTTSDIAAANISQAEDRTDKELVIKIAKSLLEKDSDEDLVKDVDAARVLRPYAIESSTISHSDSLAGEIDFAKNLAHSLAAATVWSESSFDESFSFSDEELPWLTGVDKGKDPDIQLESDQSGEEDLSQQSVEETEETSDDEEAEEKQVEAILNEPAIIYSPQYAAEFLEGGSSSIYAEATVGYHSEPYHREQPEKILEEPPKGRNLKYIGRGLDGDMEIHLWFDVEEEVIVQKPVISPVGQSERQDAQSVFRSPHFAPEPTSCKSTSTIAGHAASFPNEACLATQPPPAPSPPSCASPAYRNPPAPAFVGRNAMRPVNTIVRLLIFRHFTLMIPTFFCRK
ncbi:hypothetical protein AcW1_006702 [Taiwanofungus camphoratus]|nr:hypothetical protein AcV5_009289 [Antrodia cinnamomea]KAI0924639.1 hypothetical protein AcW2_005465 [Antrodia cinnamomea]KAI0954000.1 hypothetical protein AcV7_007368 [Antrodia cinnamomea]KAI0954980.1 hypothetical protein AcW1_006702 [Antrodia cinnamomea]